MCQLGQGPHQAVNVRFGVGRVSELADAVQKSGFKRPLLVTDPVLAAMPMVLRRAFTF